MTATQERTADPQYAKRYSVLAAVMLGSIMGPIDSSIVNIVLPTITQSFGVDISTAQWVPMIYLLTISSLLLFYGRLGDILGYRKIYLYGLAGFIIASTLCGFSPSIQWLVFFRALQGLAAGMMMAVQVLESKPGMPDSAIVGRPGMADARLIVVTASARKRPVWM